MKVETVGDKYMASSGVPEKCDDHARQICNLALDMMKASTTMQIEGKEVKVGIKVEAKAVNTHYFFHMHTFLLRAHKLAVCFGSSQIVPMNPEIWCGANGRPVL